MQTHRRPAAGRTPSLFWFSTAAIWCQLLLAVSGAGVLPQSLFAQAGTAGPASQAGPPADALPPPGEVGGESVRIVADEQEKRGHVFHLRGHVEATFRDMRLTADEIEYDETTGEVIARGHVHFVRQANQEDIRGREARYNIKTGTGTFWEAAGTVGARPAPNQTVVLTTTNPYYFEAERVEKIGPNTYMVYDGFVTSCRPESPIWTFAGSRARIEPGDSATIYNSLVKIQNKVPIFFSPFLYHSLKRIPRSSGFLTPNIGNSSRKGRVLGESFFWAINRSMDAEMGLEYYSERGWAPRGSFRMRPNANTFLSASYFSVIDRGLELPGGGRLKQGGRTLLVEGSSELPRGFRAVVNWNHLSSFLFRLAFTESFLEAVNTEVHSTAFVSNNFRGFSFNSYLSRFQNFQQFSGRVSGEAIDIRSMPSVELNSTERPLFGAGARLPLYFSFDSAVEGLARSEPPPAPGGERAGGLETGLVGRFDFFPRVSLPLNWRGVNLLATYGARATHYGSRFQNGSTSSDGFRRIVQDVKVELRPPSLQRVFPSPLKALGARVKHVVEPYASFRAVDGVDDFDRVIHFDERDLLTGTREIEYGLTNRFFGKRTDGVVRELFAWDVKQRYYFDPTFGGALVPGRRNVFASTLGLSGYSFLDGRRRFSPVVSTLRFSPTWNLSSDVRLDYDPIEGKIANAGAGLNVRVGNTFLSMSDYYVRGNTLLRPPSHQLRGQVGYGFPNRRGLNVGATFVYDMRQDLLFYSSVQANYNFDCCGVSVEFRRFQFGPTLRDERQFRLALTLANIGTFGNLKKQERMF